MGAGVPGGVRVCALRNEYPVRQHRHAERGGGGDHLHRRARAGQRRDALLHAVLDDRADPRPAHQQPAGRNAGNGKRWIRLMTQQIQTAEVEIIADLGTARVTLGDILNMKAGDILSLVVPPMVEGKVDGVPVMECTYGKFNGQYALRVEKLLTYSTNE